VKKSLLALLAALSLLAAGIFGATAANAAAGTKVYNSSYSNCYIQYKGSAGTFNVSPGAGSLNNVTHVRIPASCTGYLDEGALLKLSSGIWYTFSSFNQNGNVVLRSYL
jgi:hypothetical protein